MVSSWSKILRACASCAFAFSAGEEVVDGEVAGAVVVMFVEGEGAAAGGGIVPDGAAVDEGIVGGVPGIVVVAAVVDGDVCASVARSAEDAVVASEVVTRAVPANAKMLQAATVASCRRRAFIEDPFKGNGGRMRRQDVPIVASDPADRQHDDFAEAPVVSVDACTDRACSACRGCRRNAETGAQSRPTLAAAACAGGSRGLAFLFPGG